MTPEKRLVIKIASYLLAYPDGVWRESMESIGEPIAAIRSGPARGAFSYFLLQVQSRKLPSWQEEYSRIFDLNPATCLNLTYHKYRDQKDRGAALAHLHQVYRRAGYETATVELPDYLPLVLEFLSICSEEDYAWVLREYRTQVETLAGKLKESETPYADLLSVIVDTFRG